MLITLTKSYLIRNKKWWREVDSNHRRLSRQIYSLLPLATREPLHIFLYYIETNGADTKSRTRDLLITSQLLYQLSYVGVPFQWGVY